jgi:hypothetical protein
MAQLQGFHEPGAAEPHHILKLPQLVSAAASAAAVAAAVLVGLEP